MANVLGELFSDIAEAIRGKTGDTGTMKPAEFPEKIAGIEAGGGSGDSGDINSRVYIGNLSMTGTGMVRYSVNFGFDPDFLMLVPDSKTTTISDRNIVFFGTSNRLTDAYGRGPYNKTKYVYSGLLYEQNTGGGMETSNDYQVLYNVNATGFNIGKNQWVGSYHVFAFKLC